MDNELSKCFPAHLAHVQSVADRALAAGGFDHLLITSGVEKFQFLDDRPYGFAVNPQFKWWLPLNKNTSCWIIYSTGHKPILVYYQPDDYWHVPPSPPNGYWLEHFDVRVITDPKDALQHLPKNIARCAIIGEPEATLGDYVPNNPERVLHYLHYHRAAKTSYELILMRAASARAVRAHRAAEQGFLQGLSELEIHRRYCEAAQCTEADLPYTNIVALNEHAATLHYQYQDTVSPPQHYSLLIDAGAQVHGYAADITRTYCADAGEFNELIQSVDQVQLQLVAGVQVGCDYRDLHLQAHHHLSTILHEHKIVRMETQSIVETGVSSIFFPHGLGHLLGAQVHDVAGFAKDEGGGTIARPQGHPYLRLTRVIEKDFVLTIEPGLYFIDTLLNQLKQGKNASSVNWDKIERLKKYGGIRIEDDVRATEGAPENLTRDAFLATN